MEHTESHNDADHGSLTVKTIWLTFWLLLAITVVDFAIYFAMSDPSLKSIRNVIFILLGIVKSYFIVGVFMHMKYEKVRLAAMIITPMLFILGLIAALLYEGDRWSIIKWIE